MFYNYLSVRTRGNNDRISPMPGSDQKWTRRKWISQEIQRNSQEPVARYNLEPGMNVIYIVIENLRSPQDGLQSF